jgi:hypothetical protein
MFTTPFFKSHLPAWEPFVRKIFKKTAQITRNSSASIRVYLRFPRSVFLLQPAHPLPPPPITQRSFLGSPPELNRGSNTLFTRENELNLRARGHQAPIAHQPRQLRVAIGYADDMSRLHSSDESRWSITPCITHTLILVFPLEFVWTGLNLELNRELPPAIYHSSILHPPSLLTTHELLLTPPLKKRNCLVSQAASDLKICQT